jgi:hypothetical protein
MLYKKIVFVALVTCGALLSGCGNDEQVAHGCATSAPKSADGHFIVEGRFRKHDTGLDIKAGDGLAFGATGTVCLWGEKSCSGPARVSGTYGLWGQIGEDSLFYIGGQSTKLSATSGRLFFVLPDGPERTSCDAEVYSDNSGEFSVTVTITAAP